MSENIVKLLKIYTLSESDLIKIKEIRMQQSVRKWMYTDHDISYEEHFEWINRLKNDSSQKVFAILNSHDEPIGVISVSKIDYIHKKAEWAYYLSEKSHGGLGAILEFYFLEYVFNNHDIDKLNCEVIEGNDSVVKLHKKFLFKQEGFRESNIIKDDKRIGVHLLGLTREIWRDGRGSLLERYGRVFNNFKIIINED